MPEQEQPTKKPRVNQPEGMHKRYFGWSVRDRMAEAIKLVEEKGKSQSYAAKVTGVSRSRLNVNIGKRKDALQAAQERSEQSRRERLDAFEGEPLGGVVESPGSGLDASASSLSGPPGGSPDVPDVTGPLGPQERRRIMPAPEFIRHYFGNQICPDCDVHHDVPKLHDEIITKMTDPATRRLLINCPPYHGKSQVGTVYSTIYEICRDPNSRSALVSKAAKLCENFLYQIKKHLTDPNLYEGGPNLIDDWGPFYNQDNWSKGQIYVAGRMSGEKDPTVSVYGVGTQIYGYRFDRMIFDDIADLENQKNPERVAEMLRWATQECASRVGKTGKLAFIGTRVSPGDIYSYLIQLPAFEVVRYPCILDDVEQTVLWPEHYPYRSADEQRDTMGVEAFSLVYQNAELAGQGAAFPIDVLEACKDTSRFLGHWDPSWRLVLGVDPAGAGEQAGFTAMVVMGVDLVTGVHYIVDIVNHRQMRAPQIKDQIISWCDQYPISEIRVEVNGLQSQLFQYDVELIQKLTQRGVRFVPHITTKHNKWDAQFGVEAMGPMFYNKQISLPYGDINSRKKTDQMIEQFAMFPSGPVSDIVMASWFSALGCKELFQRFKLPAFDQRQHLPSRIAKKRRVVDFGQHEIRRPNDDEIANPYRQNQPRQLVNVAPGVGLFNG